MHILTYAPLSMTHTSFLLKLNSVPLINVLIRDNDAVIRFFKSLIFISAHSLLLCYSLSDDDDEDKVEMNATEFEIISGRLF